MQEDILTKSEILEILDEVQKPKYSDNNLLHFGRKKTSIFLVSKDTGLILVNGNEWTGLEHIDNRHSQISRIPYWNDHGKIGNPTKFDLNVAPIEYLELASKIYKPEFKNNVKNKRNDIFEVYIGSATYKSSPEVEYTLVTYKNTGIVHTLYVSSNKKPFNKRKLLDLRQGWTTASFYPMSSMETFEFGYFDLSEKEVFKVILRSSKYFGTDKWYIQISMDGLPNLTTCIKEAERHSQLPTPMRATQIDFSNVTWIEQEIKKMLSGTYQY